MRYYLAVLSSSINTNDVTLLKQLSSPECEGCQRYVSSIIEVRAAGQRVVTEGLVVKDAIAPALMDGETTVLVDFEAAPFTTFDSAGQQVSQDPGQKNLTGELRCVRTRDAKWLAMGFRLTT